ncbi:hypothetical protein [Paraburkholderia sp. UCT31]|uniref:hypothetical protein n=1 Tax=Paraburkholderia sp. UCT31 TaxID=2615209 RepID=UPI001655CD7C|nr:hypothetical protein [Paraburkholderia sp. UCT31]
MVSFASTKSAELGRDVLTHVVSACSALAIVWVVLAATETQKDPQVHAPGRVAVRMVRPLAPPAPAVQKVNAPTPVKKLAPAKPQHKVTATAVPPPVHPAVTASQPAPSESAPEIIVTGLPLDVPSAESQSRSSAPALPDDRPPLIFTDAPGGEVVVLAYKVDSDGRVLDVQIAIPSSHRFNDVAAALALHSQHFTNINPPIPAGETRWLQSRINYQSTTSDLP